MCILAYTMSKIICDGYDQFSITANRVTRIPIALPRPFKLSLLYKKHSVSKPLLYVSKKECA
jgi:hypothetical protein